MSIELVAFPLVSPRYLDVWSSAPGQRHEAFASHLRRPSCPDQEGLSQWDGARDCAMGQCVAIQSQSQDAAHGAATFSRRSTADFERPVRSAIWRIDNPSALKAASAVSESSATISLVDHAPLTKRASNGSASLPQKPRDFVNRTSNLAPSVATEPGGAGDYGNRASRDARQRQRQPR